MAAVDGMRAVVIAAHKTPYVGVLGEYVGQTQQYAWPDRDGVISFDTVALSAVDADLEYYQGAGNVESDDTVNVGISLKYNVFRGITYPRDPMLYDRDCRAGDVVIITKGATTIRAAIKELSGEYVPPDATVTAGVGNRPSQPQSVAYPQISGPTNSVEISAVDITGYDGAKYDAINAVYYIRVVVGGPPDSAVLRVRNIHEGSSRISPAAWNSPTPIGNRGIKVTFTRSGDDVFRVGQEWRVTVAQAYSAAVLLCDPLAYTGTQQLTYAIKVVEGGSAPKIVYAAAGGIDSGGPIAVGTSPTPVGRYGILVWFQQVPVCLNDEFRVDIKPGGVADYTKVVVDTLLPPEMFGPVTVSLCMHTTAAVPQPRLTEPGEFNYWYTDNSIVCPGGMLVYNAEWTDNGLPLPLLVRSATLWISYYVCRNTLTDRVRFANTVSDVDAIAGNYEKENHIKMALRAGIANSDGAPVGYIAVADPKSTANWRSAVMALDPTVVHSVIPVTNDDDVIETVVNAVRRRNDDEGARLAIWLPAIRDEEWVAVIPTCQITITEDESSQYRLVTLYGATTNGVRAGDEVHFNFDVDPWGFPVYDVRVVETVLNETQLLVTQPVSRSLYDPTPASIVMSLATVANKKRAAIGRAQWYSSAAVRLVFGECDKCFTASAVWYAFAAALAGMRSGNYPRHPLVLRSRDITAAPSDLTTADMDELIANGVTCIAGSGANTRVYGAVTTAPATDKARDEMYASVLDYCYKLIAKAIATINPETVGTTEQMLAAAGGVSRSALAPLLSGGDLYEKMLDAYDVDVSLRTIGGSPTIQVSAQITLSEDPP